VEGYIAGIWVVFLLNTKNVLSLKYCLNNSEEKIKTMKDAIISIQMFFLFEYFSMRFEIIFFFMH